MRDNLSAGGEGAKQIKLLRDDVIGVEESGEHLEDEARDGDVSRAVRETVPPFQQQDQRHQSLVPPVHLGEKVVAIRGKGVVVDGGLGDVGHLGENAGNRLPARRVVVVVRDVKGKGDVHLPRTHGSKVASDLRRGKEDERGGRTKRRKDEDEGKGTGRGVEEAEEGGGGSEDWSSFRVKWYCLF